MRDDEDLEVAKQALENRLEEFEHPLLHAFNQPKREILVGVLHGDEDPRSIIDTMDQELRSNQMDLGTFVQVQAAKNAANWCLGNLDSI